MRVLAFTLAASAAAAGRFPRPSEQLDSRQQRRSRGQWQNAEELTLSERRRAPWAVQPRREQDKLFAMVQQVSASRPTNLSHPAQSEWMALSS